MRTALARYNGSIGRRDYPDMVISAVDALERRGRPGIPQGQQQGPGRPLNRPPGALPQFAPTARLAGFCSGGSMRATPSRRESAPPSYVPSGWRMIA